MMRRPPTEWQQWLADFSQGEQTEAWRGIMCFLRWIQIRAENGHPIPNFLSAMEGDIFHSHLLRRLLDGKDPLEAPPPESFGQPWYELVEKGQGTATEVKPWEWAPEQKISVNRCIWTILEKKSNDEFIVTYRSNRDSFRLSKSAEGAWQLERLGG